MICKICQKIESNYKCPKCNLDYCSLTCFKDSKHSKCTELFYQDQVKGALSVEKFSEFSDERDKMLKILEKLKNLAYEDEDEQDLVDSDLDLDSDPDPDPLLSDKLENLNLDKLSVEELEELIGEIHMKKVKQIMIQGVSSDWLKTAECDISKNEYTSPWFIRFKPSIVIIDEKLPSYVPNSYSKSLPKLETLTKKAPSDFLWNNLLEISVIYVFIYSQFAAEELNDSSIIEIEVKPIFLELCSSFQKTDPASKIYFKSALEALESSKSTIFLNSYTETDQDFQNILMGVLSLFNMPEMLFIMLKNILSWFDCSQFGSDKFFAEKKLIFLLSWLYSETQQSRLSVIEILKTLSNIVNQYKDSF